MKRTIFLSLVFLGLFCCNTAFADGQNSGTFNLTYNGNTISAIYNVVPAEPDNIVLHIRPSSEFVLNAHVVDKDGKELIKLAPETVTGRYVNSIDVSKLPAGTYYIEVLGGTAEEKHSIPFSK